MKRAITMTRHDYSSAVARDLGAPRFTLTFDSPPLILVEMSPSYAARLRAVLGAPPGDGEVAQITFDCPVTIQLDRGDYEKLVAALAEIDEPAAPLRQKRRRSR